MANQKRTKRKNPADLTKRNNDARKNQIKKLEMRIQKLEDILRVFKVALFQWLEK